MAKYQIADVSRRLYSTLEICDFETWKTTPFRREKSSVERIRGKARKLNERAGVRRNPMSSEH